MACTAPRHCKGVFFPVAHAEISCRMPAKLVSQPSHARRETKVIISAFLAVQAVCWDIIVSKQLSASQRLNVSASAGPSVWRLRHIGANSSHLFGRSPRSNRVSLFVDACGGQVAA